MKSEFQAKFLQNLLKKRENEGFTLIELLVVIIIIGILSAIALPSFLNQANKARESEAKQYAGSLNRAQQAYFLENNTFGNTITALGVGIDSQTANYVYFVTSETDVAISPSYDATTQAKAKSYYFNVGTPINSVNLRGFIGIVDVLTEGEVGAGGTATTTAVLCQTKNPAEPDTTLASTAEDTTNIYLDTDTDNSNFPDCGDESDDTSAYRDISN